METISSSTQISRKEHRCDYCGQTIQVGEKYNRQTNVNDGTIYVWKSHFSCQEISSKLNMFDYSDEGVTEDDFREAIREEYSCLMQREHETLYKSKEFKIPKFSEQLQFVKNYHLTN